MKLFANIAVTLLAALAASALPAAAQFSPEAQPYVEYLTVPDHADRVYNTGQQATLRVEAYKGGIPLDGEWLRYSCSDEMMPVQVRDSVRFIQGIALVPMGTMTEPGFRQCELSFDAAGRRYSSVVKTAFNPEAIRACTAEPGDFDAFWDTVLSAAGGEELKADITPLPRYGSEMSEVSLVCLHISGRTVYGYLSRPKDGRKHPVLFDPPGAGTGKRSPSTFYSDRGYIYFNISIHSGANSELDDEAYRKVTAGIGDYTRAGIGDRDSFYYKDVYAACARCIDFLCSLPDWDGKNVGVTGGSQGGALTLVTAALNPKVTFCAPFYPALCDLTGFLHGRAGGWPKYFLDREETPGAQATLAYYDVVNFAKRVKCPVFFSMGFNDPVCSATSTWAAYNAITAPKTLECTRTNGHWRFGASNDRALGWMQAMLL